MDIVVKEYRKRAKTLFVGFDPQSEAHISALVSGLRAYPESNPFETRTPPESGAVTPSPTRAASCDQDTTDDMEI